MYRACSRCGRIHKTTDKCPVKIPDQNTVERSLRNKYSWAKKSKDIRDRANYLCEVCRDQGVYTYDNLEVHHVEKIKDRQDLLLDDQNLICLCNFHHRQADNGEIDKEYLYQLIERREHGVK